MRHALGHAYHGTGRAADARRSLEQALRVAESSGPAYVASQIRADLDALPK